jgi:hypothetical protein
MVYKTLPIKLKIEPHESKAVNRGRTDHAMTKQRTKNGLPILHIKRKSEQQVIHLCARGINCIPVFDFSVVFRNCSYSVVFLVFISNSDYKKFINM